MWPSKSNFTDDCVVGPRLRPMDGAKRVSRNSTRGRKACGLRAARRGRGSGFVRLNFMAVHPFGQREKEAVQITHPGGRKNAGAGVPCAPAHTPLIRGIAPPNLMPD